MGTPNGKSANWPYEEAEGPVEAYWPAGNLPPARPIPPAPNGGLYSNAPVAMSATYLTQRDQGSRPGSSFGGPTGPLVSSASAYNPYVPQSMSHDWQRQRVQLTPVNLNQDIVIIWDWDDTLMCSTAINNNQLQQHQAQHLEALLEQVLATSMKLGETCIVTNADELWVLESTRRFAPRVLPLLSQISVVSARRKCERNFPGDVFAWKRETFRELLAGRKEPSGGMNLIVLGDSPAEMEAAQSASLRLPHQSVIKTVKFKETPSVEELLEQLHIIVQELSNIVVDDKSCCRNLVNWMRQPLQTSPVPTTTAYSTLGPTTPASYTYSPHMLPASFATVAPPVTYFSTPMVYAASQ